MQAERFLVFSAIIHSTLVGVAGETRRDAFSVGNRIITMEVRFGQP